MTQKQWVSQERKTILCIDSYQDGVLQGRFYGKDRETERFDSLSQFLVKMDAMLEETQKPQAYTATRTFSSFLVPEVSGNFSGGLRKGRCATFELQILFRQHTSWQGVLIWKDRKMEQSFRSVLELVLLLDSALRDAEGREAS